MSDVYTERPRQVRARKVTPETAEDVAQWVGNGVALPGGSVLYYVGEVPNIAPVDTYIVLTDGRHSHKPAADFEAQWAPESSD